MKKISIGKELSSQVRRTLHGWEVPVWEGVATGVAGICLTPLIGTTVAPLVGAVIGVPAGKILSSYLKNPNNYYEAIYGANTIELLRRKMKEEFDASILSQGINVVKEIDDGFDALRRAGIQPKINTAEFEMSAQFQLRLVEKYLILNESEKSKVLLDAAKKISEIGRIRIKTVAVHPAAVATFKRISQVIEKIAGKGTTIQIDCSSLLGIEMLGMMNDEAKHDFVFIANSPFYLWENNDITEKYHSVFTVHSSKHLLLKKRYQNTRDNYSVIFQSGTSGQEVAWGLESKKFDYTYSPLPHGTIQIEDIANNLQHDEVLVAIAPYCDSLLKDESNQLEIAETCYNRDSLFSHSDWFKPSLDEYREAFATLFMIAWQQCRSNHDLSLDLLLKDSSYLDAFARSVGVL
jgi:hypothetical protein